MPKAEKLKRWSEQETIDVLKYLYENFDTWCDNRLNACTRAIEAAGVSENRDAKSAYNKVHNMIKTMEETDNNNKRKPNDPIWNNKRVLNLLRKICEKTKEIKDKKEEEPQEPAIKVERNTNTYEAVQFLAEMSSDTMDEDDLPNVFNFEKVNETIDNEKYKTVFDARCKEFQELPGEIKQIRSELGELEKKLREKEERLKVLKLLLEE